MVFCEMRNGKRRDQNHKSKRYALYCKHNTFRINDWRVKFGRSERNGRQGIQIRIVKDKEIVWKEGGMREKE